MELLIRCELPVIFSLCFVKKYNRLKFIWINHIRPLNINRNEFEVTARGSTFHLLVGKHAYGKYLCIPNWGIGTEISSLSDCFWNRERLEQDYPKLSKVDIISIVKTLEAHSAHM